MNNMKNCFVCFLLLVPLTLFLFASSGAALADAISGSCATYEIAVTDDGKVDWIGMVKALREGVPVYAGPDSRETTDELTFGRTVQIIRVSGKRFQVRSLSDDEPMGWVDGNDLVCRQRPLLGDNGLEQKLFIRTETSIQGDKPATVKAYPAPSGDDCHDNKCRELSRFNGYFIFAIDARNGRYLLADNYLLSEMTTLVGWVNKKDGFIWQTAYGLRPAENLVYPPGDPKAGQERAICVYPKLEDAKSGRNCQPVLGGVRWFRYPDRIPILEHTGKYYRVIVPLAGTGVRMSDEDDTEIIFGGTDISGTIDKLKRVDVFFLFDGTQSMDPYIEAIRGSSGKPGVVQEIITAFQKEEAFINAKLRFGFRVYRDAYAGNSGIGEGLPLSSDCEVTPLSVTRNLEEFSEAIGKVQASTADMLKGDNDYEENSLGGIEQALDDMLNCTDNTKVLFVIGDHGYSASAQRARNNRAVDLAALANNMKGNVSSGKKAVAVFFIQTPDNAANAKNPGAYRRAYHKFRDQGKKIVKLILNGKYDPRYLLTSDDTALPKKVIAAVQQFSDTRVATEIVADLRGGTPLVDVITRLQGVKEFRNLPGLFWDIVKQGSCKDLGELCETRIYHRILEGYVKDSRDIVVDVWLKSDDLTRWISLLGLLQDVSHYSKKQRRNAFVEALADALETVIGKPLQRDTDETLREYLLRKGALPVRDNSPLLKYSLKSLLDPREVPECEILRLATWLHDAKQMLAIVSKGDRRPVFTAERYPGECPGGKDIPFINGDINQGPIAPDDEGMNYGHAFRKAYIFWVPKVYLP